jgi:hypothetical protein
MEDDESDFFKSHRLGIGYAFIVAGVILIFLGLCTSLFEFSERYAWLDDPDARIFLTILGPLMGLAFVGGGFAGIMAVVAERDPKFKWVEMPKDFTGRPEPLMIYERECPLCHGTGTLEAQKLHDGKVNLLVFHAKCPQCGYNVELPWLSRGAAYAMFYIMLATGFFIAWYIYLNGWFMAFWEIALNGFVIVMLGVVLYMVSNYLMFRSKIVGRYIDNNIGRRVKNWNSPRK